MTPTARPVFERAFEYLSRRTTVTGFVVLARPTGHRPCHHTSQYSRHDHVDTPEYWSEAKDIDPGPLVRPRGQGTGVRSTLQAQSTTYAYEQYRVPASCTSTNAVSLLRRRGVDARKGVGHGKQSNRQQRTCSWVPCPRTTSQKKQTTNQKRAPLHLTKARDDQPLRVRRRVASTRRACAWPISPDESQYTPCQLNPIQFKVSRR